MSKVREIKMDAKTRDLLEQLRQHYYVGNICDVLRKGIALLSLHAEAQDRGAKMYIKTKDNKYRLIIV